jgi:thiaminase/transcriptional activator TenA
MMAEASASAFISAGSIDVVEAILKHPFIQDLADGSLPRANFAHFLVQDRIYIESYAACLRMLSGKAPTSDIGAMLEEHAGGAIAAESLLHDRLLTMMGIDRTHIDTVPSPTTLSYTSYLLAACALEDFLTGLVAIFPCYQIYAQVAEQLSTSASPDPVYQAWLENYAGSEYAEAVEQVRQVIDELGPTAPRHQLESLQGVYTRGAQFEWSFWDAAHIEEKWPRESGFIPRKRRRHASTPRDSPSLTANTNERRRNERDG